MTKRCKQLLAHIVGTLITVDCSVVSVESYFLSKYRLEKLNDIFMELGVIFLTIDDDKITFLRRERDKPLKCKMSLI